MYDKVTTTIDWLRELAENDDRAARRYLQECGFRFGKEEICWIVGYTAEGYPIVEWNTYEVERLQERFLLRDDPDSPTASTRSHQTVLRMRSQAEDQSPER